MATTPHVSRRSILTAASSALAGTVLAAAPLACSEASTPDPVFAAMEAYRCAHDAHAAAILTTDAAPSEEFDAAMDAQVAACKADFHAWWRLIETRPTTLPGLLAFARFLAERSDTFEFEGSIAVVMQTMAAALEPLAATATQRSA